MFGDMYSQIMRSRLGVGRPMEGYGGFAQKPPSDVNPWMRERPGEMTGDSIPQPSPWMQNGPAPTPWVQQGPGQNMPHDPLGGGIIEGGPGSYPRPKETQMTDSSMSRGQGGMRSYKNPWQRY